MFTRKCPCCNKTMSLIDFFKVSSNGSQNNVFDIKCKQCNASLISKRIFGKFIIFLWIILVAQPFLVMLIRKFMLKDEFYYYVSLLVIEFSTLMLISLLVLFHYTVSKNYSCEDTDIN